MVYFLKYFLETKKDQNQFIKGTFAIILVSLINLLVVLVLNKLIFFDILINLSIIFFMILDLLCIIKISRSTYLSQRYKLFYYLIFFFIVFTSYLILFYFTLINPDYQSNSLFNSKYAFYYGFTILFFFNFNSIGEIESRKRTGKSLWQVRRSDKELMKYEHQAIFVFISLPVMIIFTFVFVVLVKSIFNLFGNYDINLIVGIASIPLFVYTIYLVKFLWNFNDRVRNRREHVIRKLELEKNYKK